MILFWDVLIPREDTMPIALPAKIVALLGALTRADVEELTPVERERFRALCGYWAEVAKPRPMSGVLLHLAARRRDE
jgi:hypothetical protein